MLNQLSWTTYFEIIIFLAAIYYLFVLFRYYGNDLGQLVKPGVVKSETQAVPEVLRYKEPDKVRQPTAEIYPQDGWQPAKPEDSEFTQKIKECIHSASGKPFSPAVLIPQIKDIFRQHPEMANSAERFLISEMIVRECEATGTALLTEDEVDEWWMD